MNADTPCVFCAIVRGDVPANEVWRDDVAVAFLDRSPVFKGHVLIVPAVHVVTLDDLPDNERQIGAFFSRVQRVTRAVRTGLGAHGTWVSMNNTVSQSVAHLHVHVVPRHRKDGLRGFYWPREKYDNDEEAMSFATRITAALPTSAARPDGSLRPSPSA